MFEYVFRALRLPKRKREVVSEQNSTPVNIPAGEILYDEATNTLYAGAGEGPAVTINSGGGPGPNAVIDGGTYS